LQIDAGKMEIENIPYDFRAAVDDVLSLFQDKTREKNVELASLVQDAVPERVTGDPQRLRQVLMNLVRIVSEARLYFLLSMLEPWG
jgi:histidine kinase 2/3/4 (cytokinin receptor)